MRGKARAVSATYTTSGWGVGAGTRMHAAHGVRGGGRRMATVRRAAPRAAPAWGGGAGRENNARGGEKADYVHAAEPAALESHPAGPPGDAPTPRGAALGGTRNPTNPSPTLMSLRNGVHCSGYHMLQSVRAGRRGCAAKCACSLMDTCEKNAHGGRCGV